MDDEDTTDSSASFEEAVVRTIDAHGIADTLGDLAEAGVDQLLDEGFLRDVPAIGTILGVIRAAGSIRDLLLAKKLGRFLVSLQQVPVDDREAFVKSLSSPKEQRRVGETLILLLDRLDDLDKPPLVACIFGAYLQGQISYNTFRLMTSAVDRLHLPYVRALSAFYKGAADGPVDATLDKDTCQALAFAGLLRAEARGDGGGIIGAKFAGAVLVYERNDLGRQFVDVIAPDA